MSYGKVKESFWTDRKVQAWSDDAKMLALYLMTGPHRNILGCMRVPDGYLLADLGWSQTRLSDAIAMLSGCHFICRDDDGWTLILNQLKHDQIKVPNHARSAVSLANDVPRESVVFQHLEPRLKAALDAIGMASLWHVDEIAIPEPSPEPSPAPAPAPSLRSGGARAKPGPADLDPAEFRTLAEQERRDVDRELANFRDWCAKTGRQFKDYPAAFRHWLRSEYGRAPPGKANDAAATEARLRRHFEQMERDHGPEAMGGGEVVPLTDAARLRSAEERGR